jgi:flagellar biosynthesis GTPase FlhF
MPFGRTPPGFDPDKPNGSVDGQTGAAAEATAAEVEASEIEQQILSSVQVSMLNRTTDGRVFVGFTDSSVQPAKNYLLELGEKREQCEWQVVSVDSDCRQVTLSKGGVEATLMLGGGGGPTEEKKEKPGEEAGKFAARPGMLRGRPHAMMSGAPGVSADASDGASKGLEGRLTGLDLARARRQRTIQMQQAEAEQKRQAAEQAEKERRQLAQEREQERRERELAAQERKAQLDQLMQIQEELRRQREEKAQREAAAAEAAAAQQQGEEQPPVEE